NITGVGKIDTAGKNSTVSGEISGGVLEKTGSGSLTLTAETNSQIRTVINGGILIVKDSNDDKISSLGAGELEIKKGTLQTDNDMTLTNTVKTSGSAGGSINTAGHEVTLEGQVTGAGRLVKTGGGTLTVSNNSNDYNIGTGIDADGKVVAIIGNTIINGGVLAIDDDKQLGKKPEKVGEFLVEDEQYKWKLGNVQIDGGTLQTTSSIDSQRYVVVGSAGATIDVDGAANTTTLSGLVEGAGVLTKKGEGTLKLSLASGNYKQDSTTVAEDFKKNTLGAVNVNAGVLEIDNTAKDFGGTVAVSLAGGELRINQGVSTGADLGIVTLQGTGGTIDTTGATIRTGVITGSGGLTKQGSGTLVLTDLNNQGFTGDTTISQGKVQINSAQGLGANGQLVLDGGSLQVVGSQDVALNKNAVITSNNGTIDNVTNNVTLSGTVSGDGQLVKSGAGTLSLSNEKNTFKGGVRIKDGTLQVSTDGSLGLENTKVLIDGATLAIAQDAELKRQIVLTEKGGTVSVADNSSATLSGELALDNNVLSADLTKAGKGTLNLTRDNTQGNFKGNTIIKEGTLGITSQNNLAQGKLFLDGGNLRTNASLNFDKEIIINTTGGIDAALDANGNQANVSVSGKIQGNGGFVKTGVSTVTLTADNAYAGGTQIKAGTLVVNKDSNLGLSSTNIELDGGTVKLTNANSIDFKTSSPKQSDGNYPDARKLLIGNDGGILDIEGLDVAIETEISGKGTLTQKGTSDSVLTLTANNTALEGGLTVENGTLKIQNNTNLGAFAAGTIWFTNLDHGRRHQPLPLMSEKD
ncbi:MAG: autotransporter-associated beta strand repeat-containing protein, partial [Pseudomonadales bacterium]|nr:autotransporter-associated beta strand repeat-containing protein [Pseudomonadales bacterium]